MRVAFYTSTILEHSGGLEKFFIDVASSLSERFDELDIDIITNSDRFAERLQGVLSVYYLKRLEVSNVYKESPSQIRARLGNKVNYIKATSMRQLRLLLQRYDVVYSKNELIEVIIFRLLGYRHLPPVIFGCHTTLYYPNARSFHTRLHNILYTGKVYRILTKSARAFHVLNYTDYRILCEGEVDCVLIPNPFNFDGFRSEFCSEGDSALAVDPDRFNVVWAGRLTEQKGIDRLISIIYQCQDEEWGGNIVWNIFGDGERREDVERLTREVRGVRYFGHVEEARLVGFMAMCQVLVSTSLWESFGYSIMQGIGANIPVISFDIPGPNEIICDGGNGFLVADVGQFIEKLQFLILGGVLSNLEVVWRGLLQTKSIQCYVQCYTMRREIPVVRIVHILPAFYPGRVHDFELMSSRGGAERYVCELSSAMSERVNTTLIVFGEEDDEFMYNSLSIRIVQSRPFLPRLNGHVNFSSLSLMPIFGSFDVIHAHQYYADTTLLAAFAAKMYRRKFYVTDLGWRGINFSRYIPMKYLCDKILGLTAYDVHRFRVSASKIAIIGGGVDLSKYNYVEDKKRKVVYVGRILPHKGIENLIAAVGNDIECVIAGHALNDRYFNLLKELAIDRKVNFLLSASDAEIRSHIEEAAALVLPSVDVDLYGRGYHNSELFGLVIAEAFVCGTPSIVSDSSALPFVVDHEITGYVVPQNSPSAIRQRILQLFDNQFDAIEMGKRCRAKALRFYGWTEVADRCLANYGIDD